MKSSLKLIFGFAFLVAFILVFTSCEKENVDKIIEETVEGEPSNILSTNGTAVNATKSSGNTAIISFQGNTTVINAYASYCNQNNKEFLTVTNNQALLSTSSVFSINSNDLNDGDFITTYMIDTTSTLPQTFTLWSKIDTTQGQTNIELLIGDATTFNFSVDPVLNSVKGNVSGMFMAGLIGGNPIPTPTPYTINFDANILQPNTFCN